MERRLDELTHEAFKNGGPVFVIRPTEILAIV